MNSLDWSNYKGEYIYRDENVTTEYLFNHQLNMVSNILKANISAESKNINKVIGISGERGSGKSSFLYTLEHSINNRFIEKDKDYYALRPIDPNYLDRNMGLLEIILATLYEEISIYISENKSKSLSKAKEVRALIIEQIELQTNVRSETYFRKNATPEDIAIEFNRRIKIKESYEDIFKIFWSVMTNNREDEYKAGLLVILIDDLDIVDNSLIYEMLEDIKQILGQSVSTIITYRKNQLEHSLYDIKLKENKEILGKFVDDNEIRKQGNTYIEKLIAKGNIVTLDSDEFLETTLEGFFNADQKLLQGLKDRNFESSKSVIDNIYIIIEKNVLINIKSQNDDERDTFESLFTLRNTIQFFELCETKFKTIRYKDKLTSLKNNLQVFKEYIINIIELMEFTEEETQIIHGWMRARSNAKNYFLYKSLAKILEINNPADILNTSIVQNYNVSLADVMEILYDNNARNNMRFIMKTLYSIELLSSLINDIYIESNGKIQFKEMTYQSDKTPYLSQCSGDKVNKYWETNYYNLTRYKMTPKSLMKDRFIIKVTSNQKKNLNFDDYGTLNKILYTTIAYYGDIRKTARSRGKLEIPLRIPSYKYREYFLPILGNGLQKNSEDINQAKYYYNFRASNTYPCDFFTCLVKESHLNRLIEGKNVYLFYSLFDFDLAFRAYYDVKRGDELVKTTVKTVNEVISTWGKYENRLGKILIDNDNVEDDEIFNESSNILKYIAPLEKDKSEDKHDKSEDEDGVDELIETETE